MTTKRTYGSHGLSVTLWREGERIRAQWRERGRRKKRSWPNTPANWKVAQAWAEGFSERRQLVGVLPARLTLRELWTRFIDANDHLRQKTVENYRQRWRKLELFAGRDCRADDVTTAMLDEFRAALRKIHAPNQVRLIIKAAQVVFNWGESRELVTKNKLATYSIPQSKDARTQRPEEYRIEEFRALQRQLDPQDSRQWRAWAVLTLVGNQGVRISAALALRWQDIGPEFITWPAESDKTGREWRQPIREETRHVFKVARAWAESDSYPGDLVFYSSHDEGAAAYGVQAFWYQLTEAEKRAGVPHRPLRAAHGFRRMVVTEIVARTGNLVHALQFVGDRDLKQARSYVKERLDELQGVAAILDSEGPAKAPDTFSDVAAVTEVLQESVVAESHRSDLNRRPQPHSFLAPAQETLESPESQGPESQVAAPKEPRNGQSNGPAEAPGADHSAGCSA